MSKSYRQYCALARALDHVGDRWTLLVLRELLIDGTLAFTELSRALPGIPSNLLVDRLRQLERDGLVERNAAPPRSKAVRYSLTPFGRAVEPAILAFIRWGAAFMPMGPDGDHVDPRWGGLALRALLTDPSRRSPRGRVEVVVGGMPLTIEITRDGRSVRFERAYEPRATVTGGLPETLAVASGLTSLGRSALKVTGDRAFARVAFAQR